MLGQKNRNRELTVAVGTSIIASIFFVYFLDPILTFIGKFILNVGGHFYEKLVSTVYKEIALAKPDFDFYLFLFFGVLSILYVIENSDTISYLIYKVINTGITGKTEAGRRRIDRIIDFLVVIYALLWTFILSVSFIELKAVNEFNQEMKILSPYISNQQEKELLAKFASMQSSSDYVTINKDILHLINFKKIPVPSYIVERIMTKAN